MRDRVSTLTANNKRNKMIFNTLLDALQQSMIFIPLTLGIYLCYRILSITDLTPDGTFVLGAAIFSRLLTSGYSQTTSIIIALLGGVLAGIGVCLLQRFAKINSLIASILAVFMLYSVNFAIMGTPNINLLNYSLFIQNIQNSSQTLFNLVLIIFTLALIFLLFLFINSRTGLKLRAFGSNKFLLEKLGKHPTLYLALGLAISNALASLCGVFSAQLNGYADIHMGVGMALTGIGAVVIGCKLARSMFCKNTNFNLKVDLFGCLLGTYIYFLVVNLFLMLGINPIYLKLLLGLLLAVFLSTTNYTQKSNIRREQYE
jgi:putative ABC transport system permease protein